MPRIHKRSDGPQRAQWSRSLHIFGWKGKGVKFRVCTNTQPRISSCLGAVKRTSAAPTESLSVFYVVSASTNGTRILCLKQTEVCGHVFCIKF